jgi:hypothetical protein
MDRSKEEPVSSAGLLPGQYTIGDAVVGAFEGLMDDYIKAIEEMYSYSYIEKLRQRAGPG